MKIKVTLGLGILAVSLASVAFADLKEFSFQRKQMLERRIFNSGRAPVRAKIFEQKIDHFLKGASATFKQRYFLDTTFTSGSGAPVLFYICGESICEGAILDEPIGSLAKKLGATVVALEHRYYGYSQPFEDLSSESLQYLTTAQAIEDLAEFQKFAIEKHDLRGKWIAIGGSYPGNLAAYYRLKYPELVAGAWASSAPVQAKAKFEEYDRHVAQVVTRSCLSKIRLVVDQVEAPRQPLYSEQFKLSVTPQQFALTSRR